MNTYRKKSIIGIFVLFLTLPMSYDVFAWHGGGRGWHGGGWHGGGWHNRGWYGPAIGAGIVGGTLLLNAPYNYNNYNCAIVRVCDTYGCSVQRYCN